MHLISDKTIYDNNSPGKRKGSEVTYKRKKGFQPLHVYRGTFLKDLMFRKGSTHSTHDTDYITRVKSVVMLICERYPCYVTIVPCADSGFIDQKAYDVFERGTSFTHGVDHYLR